MFDWIKKQAVSQTQALYVARPDQAANYLIWAHPDRSIPRGSKITVRSDEVALFFREGAIHWRNATWNSPHGYS